MPAKAKPKAKTPVKRKPRAAPAAVKPKVKAPVKRKPKAAPAAKPKAKRKSRAKANPTTMTRATAKQEPRSKPKRSSKMSPAMEAQKGKGRVKGSKNKLGMEVKVMIETALSQADPKGGVEYLRKQSAANPVAFMGLVGKILPKQIDVGVSVLAVDLLDVMTARRTELAKRRAAVLADVIEGELIDAEDD
jgi:hypothetical protein